MDRQEIPESARDLSVQLTRGDYLYFNWVLAFDRPMLPFMVYTLVLVNLASLLGIWPDGRIFGLALLIPILGYSVWLTLSANGPLVFPVSGPSTAPRARQRRQARRSRRTFPTRRIDPRAARGIFST